MKTERTYYILQYPYLDFWVDYQYHDGGQDIVYKGNTVEKLFQHIMNYNYDDPYQTLDELKAYIKGWRLVKICEIKELEDLEQYLN